MPLPALLCLLALLPPALPAPGEPSPLLPSSTSHPPPLLAATNTSSPATKARPSTGEVWGYGLLMVTLISLTSIVGVGVLPLMSRSFYSNLLTALIGLAVGSLAGSAVFHLIPSAFRQD